MRSFTGVTLAIFYAIMLVVMASMSGFGTSPSAHALAVPQKMAEGGMDLLTALLRDQASDNPTIQLDRLTSLSGMKEYLKELAKTHGPSLAGDVAGTLVTGATTAALGPVGLTVGAQAGEATSNLVEGLLRKLVDKKQSSAGNETAPNPPAVQGPTGSPRRRKCRRPSYKPYAAIPNPA
ncbi:hypothetical protein THASP1DRAFT_28190 [Thamnocephalis sphaerospora]|uniref:Uncharacterized protein n=1 Tax=Thamnocephalis sphaerospora TaxID=78915 RepID=A0A4P9XX71_9FUNG|nr:hypothetical protein THASP1DRAFT_28190 [Thamnocephalis sphaerospora]|eukprot:RKP10040.1 hypothetical protein THASP1DRAFT_28190 [Thamnocephalis sphaerospora]